MDWKASFLDSSVGQVEQMKRAQDLNPSRDYVSAERESRLELHLDNAFIALSSHLNFATSTHQISCSVAQQIIPVLYDQYLWCSKRALICQHDAD